MILKKVVPMSAAKIMGVLYLILGFIMGCIFALISMVAGGALSQTEGGPLFAMMFGAGAIIILPIMYGVMGFLMGLIGSLIYNWLAGIVGGIELDLQ